MSSLFSPTDLQPAELFLLLALLLLQRGVNLRGGQVEVLSEGQAQDILKELCGRKCDKKNSQQRNIVFDFRTRSSLPYLKAARTCPKTLRSLRYSGSTSTTPSKKK